MEKKDDGFVTAAVANDPLLGPLFVELDDLWQIHDWEAMLNQWRVAGSTAWQQGQWETACAAYRRVAFCAVKAEMCRPALYAMVRSSLIELDRPLLKYLQNMVSRATDMTSAERATAERNLALLEAVAQNEGQAVLQAINALIGAKGHGTPITPGERAAWREQRTAVVDEVIVWMMGKGEFDNAEDPVIVRFRELLATRTERVTPSISFALPTPPPARQVAARRTVD